MRIELQVQLAEPEEGRVVFLHLHRDMLVGLGMGVVVLLVHMGLGLLVAGMR